MAIAAALDSRRVDGSDLDYALRRVSGAYRTDAYDEDSADGLIIRDIWNDAIAKGMTGAEFRERLVRMIHRNVYPTWTPGDFFKDDAVPKLYPRSWYLDRVHADRTESDRIAVYKLPDGRTGYAYRDVVGDRLVEYIPQPHSEPTIESEPEEPTPDTRKQISLVKVELERDDLAAEVKRLTEKLTKLTAQLSALRADRAVHVDTIGAYEELITDLLNGTMTIEKLREELAEPDPPELTTEELKQELAAGGK